MVSDRSFFFYNVDRAEPTERGNDAIPPFKGGSPRLTERVFLF
jgi:hypothetical protein